LEVFLLKALIVANGELELPPQWESMRDEFDLILAADGGSRHLSALGLNADLIVGDMDSVAAEDRLDLENSAAKWIQYPTEKDQTDLELALFELQGRGVQEVTVLAGLGRRWDHSLANILLATLPELESVQIAFWQGSQRLFLLQKEEILHEIIGSRMSLIPLGAEVQAVQTSGLEFELKRETLSLGSSRGISNVVINEEQKITHSAGLLLCILSPGDFS
jgi:thiamine pyrophosphokinase